MVSLPNVPANGPESAEAKHQAASISEADGVCKLNSGAPENQAAASLDATRPSQPEYADKLPASQALVQAEPASTVATDQAVAAKAPIAPGQPSVLPVTAPVVGSVNTSNTCQMAARTSANKVEPKPQPTPLKFGAGFFILTFFAYLAIAVFSTWPLPLNCKNTVLGYIGFENTAQTLWLYYAWHSYQADLCQQFYHQYGVLGSLLHLGDFYHLCMAYPERNSVANGLDFFWTWPLEALFGFPLYYNVKIWLVLALDGLAACWLAQALGTKKPAAFAAGLIFAFNPHHFYLASTGRMIELQTFLPVLAALALYKAWRSNQPWRWALAGAALGVVTDNYWFYGHFMIVYTVAFLIYQLIAKNPPRLGSCGRHLIFYVMAFLVIVLPFAHPYLVRYSVGERIPGMVRPDPGNLPSMIRLTRQMIAFSAEADYPIHQASLYVNTPNGAPWWIPLQCTFLANAVLLGLLPALFLRKGGFWLAGAIFFYLLPLGPFLKYHGDIVQLGQHPVPLPYLYLIQYMPLISKLFWPSQSMFLMALCLSMLVALNFNWFLDRKGLSKLMPTMLIICIMSVGSLEMLHRNQLPLPQTKLNIPEIYTQAGRGQGYIFLPLGRRYWEVPRDYNRDYYHGADLTIIDLHLTMSEGKGLFGRPHYMAGKDYWLYEPSNLSTQKFLRWVTALGIRPSPEFSAEDLAEVQRDGYKYFVVHERICDHVQDRGSYRVNFAVGQENFEKICKELSEKFGPPVYEGVEDSYDQGIQTGSVVLHSFRIRIYEIKAKPTQTKRSKA